MKGYGISCLTLSVLMVVIQLQDVKARLFDRRYVDSFLNIGRRYFHEPRKDFKFECPAGQSLQSVKSVKPKKTEDRMSDFTCTDLPMGKLQEGGITSVWTPFSKRSKGQKNSCDDKSIITGIKSEFKGSYWFTSADRIYSFKCSKLEDASVENCMFTEYLMTWWKPLDYSVPEGMVMHGVGTSYWSRYADRRMKFEVCKVKKN